MKISKEKLNNIIDRAAFYACGYEETLEAYLDIVKVVNIYIKFGRTKETIYKAIELLGIEIK